MNLNGKKVLVTGGAGFIGSHLCDRLLSEPVETIIAVDNLYLGKTQNLKKAFSYPNFEFIEADICDFDYLQGIIIRNKIDIIFHLAVIPLETSIDQPVWSFNQNVRMTQNILEVIRRQNREIALVAFSTSEVYGSAAYTPMNEIHPFQSHTPYAASKVASDMLIYSYAKTYGLEFVIIRPFNNYGPRQNEGNYAGLIPLTIQRILNNEMPVIYDDGNQTRDFIFVEDTTYWTVEITKCNQAYRKMINLASGNQVSVEQVIRTICNAMNYSGGIEYRPKRPGDVSEHQGDVQLIQDLVNFETRTNFRTGIAKTVEWYRNNLEEQKDVNF